MLRKSELFINFGSIQKLKSNLLNYLLVLYLRRKLNDHVRVAERHNKSMFEHKVFVVIHPDKCSRTIPKISEVVLFVKLLVLNHHMPFAYSSKWLGIVLSSVRII